MPPEKNQLEQVSTKPKQMKLQGSAETKQKCEIHLYMQREYDNFFFCLILIHNALRGNLFDIEKHIYVLKNCFLKEIKF